MKENVLNLLAQRGPEAVIDSITKTIVSLQALDYSRAEISETVRGCYFGMESKVDAFIISKGL